MDTEVVSIFEVDVLEALAEVINANGLEQTEREKHPLSAHHSIKSASLRIPAPTGDKVWDIFNQVKTIDSPLAKIYPACYSLCLGLAKILNAKSLGRIMIAMLPAGKNIDKHTDEGDYPDYYDRFHIFLSGNCEWNETKMEAGNVYSVNNSKPHQVVGGHEDRISIIVDLKVN